MEQACSRGLPHLTNSQAGYGTLQQLNAGPSCMHASRAESRHELVLMPVTDPESRAAQENPQTRYAMSFRRHLCVPLLLQSCTDAELAGHQGAQRNALLNVIVQAIRQGPVRQRRVVVNRHVHVQPSLRRAHVAGLQGRVRRRRVAGRQCARACALGGPRALLLLCTCAQTADLPLQKGMSSII